MAVQTFGVDSDLVRSFTAQYFAQNAVTPDVGTGAIIETQWINYAAAEVNDALTQGGHSITSIASDSTSVAYILCQQAVAIGSVCKYNRSVNNQAQSGGIDIVCSDFKMWLDRFSSGETIGDSDPDSAVQQGKFYHGDTTRTELNDERITRNDSL